MLGAGFVTSFELDDSAISDFTYNITEFEIDNIEMIQCNVRDDLFSGFTCDTVIMNPPFGTKNNEGVDMEFLDQACHIAQSAVYSFHKSSTRDFIVKRMESRGYKIEVLSEMKFKVPKMYKMHKKNMIYVDVDFIRIAIGGSEDVR